MNHDEQRLDHLFFALAHAARRSIIEQLAHGDATVSELAEPLDISAPAVTKHLKVLERAQLIQRTIDGRVHRCSLRPSSLQTAEEWIEFQREFWNQSFDRLAELIENQADQAAQPRPRGTSNNPPRQESDDDDQRDEEP